jgi:lytic murein transglycosylase
MKKGLGPGMMRYRLFLSTLGFLLPLGWGWTLDSAPVKAQGIEFGPTEQRPTPSKPKTQAVQPVKPAGTVAAQPKSRQVPGPGTPNPLAAKYATSGLPPKPNPANCKNTVGFDTWLAAFRKEAAANGISPRTISLALDGRTLDGGVIARDRKQGFFAQSFTDFAAKLATNNRVTNGRAQIKRNAETFARAGKEYGVPASVITGFWALESDFGAGMGKLPIMNSLTTLAYDCRRGEMFRQELMAALEIIDRGDMTPDTMIGSWAGEIGQTQFLPTRYLAHAIDYDGDGDINLFENATDIIGSTANYMTHLGWRRDEPWLEEVVVTSDLPWDKAELATKLPRSQWASWGVTKADGSALPNDSMPASLLLPMGRYGPAFLAYENFNVYLQWNQSLSYAITAAWLATRIDGAPVMQKPKRQIPVLAQDEAKELQRQLKRRGFDVGEVDGKIGASTRAAVKAMQVKLGLPADSYPTPELLTALRGES